MFELLSSQHYYYDYFMVIFSPRLGILFSNRIKLYLSICDSNQTWDYSYRSLLESNESYDSCIAYMTGSSPRCPLRSHSLICIENCLFIVGIGTNSQ